MSNPRGQRVSVKSDMDIDRELRDAETVELRLLTIEGRIRDLLHRVAELEKPTAGAKGALISHLERRHGR